MGDTKNAFKEMFSAEKFSGTFADINMFTQDLMGDYCETLHDPTTADSKEIYDALWSSIEVSAAEMIIIDSPIIQRLKQISQLGMADYVYPGSSYSRFYHTLGVMHLSSQMASVINNINGHESEENKVLIKHLVRYSSIFHDSGHTLYSHASEIFFEKNPRSKVFVAVNEMLDEVLVQTGCEVNLHELLSCMIVNSDSVAELLRHSFQSSGNNALMNQGMFEKHLEYITCLIIGVPTDKNILPYSKIVNGPVDSDKCDYLTRDSYVTKLPVAVDISRLIRKLSLIEVGEDKFNMPSIWRDENPSMPYYELAVKDSAEKSLFQLCMARNAMFGSVYYHQKVLTAETYLRDIICSFQELYPEWFDKFSSILKLTDDLLGQMTIMMLQTDAQAEKNQDRKKKLLHLTVRIKGLLNRKLCKRVISFKKASLGCDEGKVSLFWNRTILSADSSCMEEFLENVKLEYLSICKLFNTTPNPEDNELFFISQPAMNYDHSKIKIHIDLGNGEKRDYRGYSYFDSKESSDNEFLLVSNQHRRDYVLLASEKVLYEKHGVLLMNDSSACSKYSIKDINRLRKMLYEKGYYDGKFFILIPDDLLYDYKILKNDIEGIKQLYSSYEGPDGFRVDENGIKNFLKQFMSCFKDKRNTVELLKGIVDLLRNGIYINRETFVTAFSQTLKEKEVSSCNICNVGCLLDSGGHMSYYLNDIKERFAGANIIMNLHDWLSRSENGENIVFFDDGAYSGTQILSIFQEYLGAESRVTTENHVGELPDGLKEKLRNADITLFFVCFNKTNEENLINEFEKLGIHNLRIRYKHDMNGDLFDRQPQVVQETLEEVGLSLIESTKKGKSRWDDTRIKEAALGYNMAKQMVILKSSVPTYTITAFWSEGITHNGIDWKPLFKRTQKS